jgi:hypothetical protein
LVSIGSAEAQSYWEEASDRLRDVTSWEELCEIEDCSQFPNGYVTFALGPELYYLPLPQSFDERVSAAYNIPGGRLIELDEGRIGRSFDYHHSSLRLDLSGNQLLRFFGLDQGFPEILRETHSPPLSGASVRLDAASSPRSFRIESRRWIDSGMHDPPLPFDEIFRDPLPSFNEDFWLLNYNPADKDDLSYNGHDGYSILSKQRIFNGRHIYGSCKYPTCAFFTADFAEDEGNQLPRIRILSVWVDGIDDFRCVVEHQDWSCNEPPEAFGQIDEVFARLEVMFASLKIYPEIDRND